MQHFDFVNWRIRFLMSRTGLLDNETIRSHCVHDIHPYEIEICERQFISNTFDMIRCNQFDKKNRSFFKLDVVLKGCVMRLGSGCMIIDS